MCPDICLLTFSGPKSSHFPRAKLEDNCELRGTDYRLSAKDKYPDLHVFLKIKWRLLDLLSFRCF